MKLPPGFRLGAATHTGLVRSQNEDDYLLVAVPGSPPGMLVAIADGMGGVAGGAEASRLALRSFAARVLDERGEGGLAERLQQGVAAAARRLAAEAEAVPALRDMGTTLTALFLTVGEVGLAHVGDTRCYRWRAGEWQQLTTDHAAREPQNLLLRCVGAGEVECRPDLLQLPFAAGDRYLLVSDGVWSVLPPERLPALVAAGPPQAAAEALVEAALAAGGPDNATAVLVELVAATASSGERQELPRGERPGRARAWPPAGSLRRPVWPWLLWLLALVLAVLALLRGALGIDGLAWLLRRF